MAMTKAEAAQMLNSDGNRSGPDAEKEAECLQACYNGLLPLVGLGSLNYTQLFLKALDIINIIRGPGTWSEKIAAVFALFNQVVPPSVKMP